MCGWVLRCSHLRPPLRAISTAARNASAMRCPVSPWSGVSQCMAWCSNSRSAATQPASRDAGGEFRALDVATLFGASALDHAAANIARLHELLSCAVANRGVADDETSLHLAIERPAGVRACLRRTRAGPRMNGASAAPRIAVGQVLVDLDQHLAKCGDVPYSCRGRSRASCIT